MVPFKAFASLRLQSETIRGQKNTFFCDEKTNYCFLPVFREKNTIFHVLGKIPLKDKYIQTKGSTKKLKVSESM